MVPYFKIGDTVKYETYCETDRAGTIIDILLPVPPIYVRIGRALTHAYHVSYLVRIIRQENRGETGYFFDNKDIEFLRTLNTVEVVREGVMFFEDGQSFDEAFGPYYHRSRRTFVTSWDEYVAEVERRNPQLKDRLTRFTAKLRELNCLG